MDLNIYNTGSSPYDNAIAFKYKEGDYSLDYVVPTISFTGNEIKHTLKEGETLQNIAYRYYGDSGLWYLIAEANQILNPFSDELYDGLILIIPN
jgi:nucleoid-associated protein YgaU|nr:MAG TPA: baseplate wedge protein [Caudoviricetes sp.]